MVVAPKLANLSAMAAPIPRPPPVTRAILPFKVWSMCFPSFNLRSLLSKAFLFCGIQERFIQVGV
jgi:hypothetical protein